MSIFNFNKKSKTKDENDKKYRLIENEIKKFSKSKLNKCLKDAEYIAIKAGKYSLKYFGAPRKVSKKGKTDLFTEIDLKNEETIKKYLLKKYPKFAFLGEESNNFEDKIFLG